jgi:fumarate hydratase subunit beta
MKGRWKKFLSYYTNYKVLFFKDMFCAMVSAAITLVYPMLTRYITGTIYVARDAAHKRMIEALQRGEELPIDIKDSTIYYMGPSPAREGRPIGSAGPTTASRMDKYAPTLLDLGEKAMIGKGKRTKEVIDAIVRNHAVYFAAIGGAGALLSKCITKSEIVCYEDLGAEAIRKIEIKDFPVIVVIDSQGNNLYETAIREFASI